MRIAVGGFMHETSTCVDTHTTMQDFEFDRGIVRGDDVITKFAGTNVCTGGFVDGAKEFGFESVPLLRASAFPGGLIVRDDYERIKGELLSRLDEAQRRDGPVDGVLLDLHGAMVVEGIDDGDGDMVAAVRKLVGPKIPIIVTPISTATTLNCVFARPTRILATTRFHMSTWRNAGSRRPR